jgi:hypothetical protein
VNGGQTHCSRESQTGQDKVGDETSAADVNRFGESPTPGCAEGTSKAFGSFHAREAHAWDVQGVGCDVIQLDYPHGILPCVSMEKWEAMRPVSIIL